MLGADEQDNIGARIKLYIKAIEKHLPPSAKVKQLRDFVKAREQYFSEWIHMLDRHWDDLQKLNHFINDYLAKATKIIAYFEGQGDG